MEDEEQVTEEHIRLTALELALDFSNREQHATKDTVLRDAEAFRAFLTGEAAPVAN